jgi:hypothetical protein
MMLLVVAVDILLLKLRWGSVYSSHLLIIVAIFEVLHLEEIIVATWLLITMLLMDLLSGWLRLRLEVHLQHVVSLRLCSCCLQGWKLVHWSSHVIRTTTRAMSIVRGE